MLNVQNLIFLQFFKLKCVEAIIYPFLNNHAEMMDLR